MALVDAFEGLSLPQEPTSESSSEVTVKPTSDGWFIVRVAGSTVYKLKEKIYWQKGYALG